MDADLAVGPPWGHRWAGRIHDHVLDSEVLNGNPLGDPFRRPLYVYTPPAYEAEPNALPDDLSHPGTDRAGRHVASAEGVPPDRARG